MSSNTIAGLSPKAVKINNNQRSKSRRRSHSTLLLDVAQTLTVVPSPTFIEDGFTALRENLELTALNTLEPVTEASTDTCEDGVGPETLLGENRTHFDTELPETDGDACGCPMR